MGDNLWCVVCLYHSLRWHGQWSRRMLQCTGCLAKVHRNLSSLVCQQASYLLEGSGGLDSSAAGVLLSFEMCRRGTLQNDQHGAWWTCDVCVCSGLFCLTMITWSSLGRRSYVCGLLYPVCCNKDVAGAIFSSASLSPWCLLPQSWLHVDLAVPSLHSLPVCQLPHSLGCCNGMGSTGWLFAQWTAAVWLVMERRCLRKWPLPLTLIEDFSIHVGGSLQSSGEIVKKSQSGPFECHTYYNYCYYHRSIFKHCSQLIWSKLTWCQKCLIWWSWYHFHYEKCVLKGNNWFWTWLIS